MADERPTIRLCDVPSCNLPNNTLVAFHKGIRCSQIVHLLCAELDDMLDVVCKIDCNGSVSETSNHEKKFKNCLQQYQYLLLFQPIQFFFAYLFQISNQQHPTHLMYILSVMLILKKLNAVEVVALIITEDHPKNANIILSVLNPQRTIFLWQ